MRQWPVVAVVAAGGVIGALIRYGVGVLFPHAHSAFPWATFGINVTGCLAIGALLVAITEGYAAHRLARPFLGTGVLGGYTTFSTYAVDARQLLDAGRTALALVYLVSTLAAALAATQFGVFGMRWILRWILRRRLA